MRHGLLYSQLKYLSVIYLLGVVMFMSSCGTVNKITWSTEHIKVNSAYIQKHIPGRPETPPTTYLFVEMEILDDAIAIDSVYYNGYGVAVSGSKHPLKIDWLKGKLLASEEIDKNEAILYYSKESTPYKQLIGKIQVKEDLFFP